MANPVVPSLRWNFQSSYRGGTKTWSTRQFFSGGTPANLTDWTALINNLKSYVKPSVGSWATLQTVDCLVPGTEIPLHTVSVNEAGTFPAASTIPMPLEVCALIRWSTDQRTSKNHPIYLFNYIHSVGRMPSQTDYELLDTNQKSNMQQWVDHWMSGITISGQTFYRAGPRGGTAQSGTVETYLHHRDFPS